MYHRMQIGEIDAARFGETNDHHRFIGCRDPTRGKRIRSGLDGHRASVSTRVPSGLKATDQTKLSCPRKVRIASPVAASHRRAVLSLDPVSTRAPSGLKATEMTAS